jgi:hypothetical protein
MSLLSERRAFQGAAASVNCEEAEWEALKDKKRIRSGEEDLGGVIESNPEAHEGVPKPSRTRRGASKQPGA